jgi:hypothetical protein
MARLLYAALLLGCPQLLDDSFDVAPALPATSLDSGGQRANSGSDAGTGLSGAGGVPGAGGTLNAAGTASQGTGGSIEQPDASAAGSAGGDPSPWRDAAPPATELGSLLLHRYRFDGDGDTAIDEVGAANGTLIGTTLSAGSGKVSLSGSAAQYVDLPDGLISSLQSVTIEAWVNWLESPDGYNSEWQNIFDFGSNNGVSDLEQGTRLYLTSKSSLTGFIRAGYTLTGYNHELYADGTHVLPTSANAALGTQLVLVAGGPDGSLVIYINGAKEASAPLLPAIDITKISDVNDWLGRSQYHAPPYIDPNFHGEILDFRIYSGPLSAAQVALSYSLGADGDL